MGSGTISGTDAASLGSMLELSWMGSREVKLGDNEITWKSWVWSMYGESFTSLHFSTRRYGCHPRV